MARVIQAAGSAFARRVLFIITTLRPITGMTGEMIGVTMTIMTDITVLAAEIAAGNRWHCRIAMVSICKALYKSRRNHGDVLGGVIVALIFLAMAGLLTTPKEPASANGIRCHVIVCGLRG
ncbi:MAG: hypothetical protein HXY27_03800 [Hydrogenophilaceae bacterium]|nr:hypothetical protein [Hydrogenophilaceae bacterium]